MHASPTAISLGNAEPQREYFESACHSQATVSRGLPG